MKKTLPAITFVFILLAGGMTARAHFLKSDGNIGAVLHIDPDDDPIVGESARFVFDVKDKDGKFSLGTCDCRGIITEDGKEVFSGNAVQAGQDVPGFDYVFQQKGVYVVKLVGSPAQPGAFQPFTLSWDVRVSREASDTNGRANQLGSWLSVHAVHLLLVIAASGYVVYQTYLERKRMAAKK